MNRYDIAIRKTPPPPEPEPEIKPPKKKSNSTLSIVYPNDSIAQLVLTAEGRTRLAASFVGPAEIRINSVSIARRIFHVENLPNGASAVYDRNLEYPAYCIDDNGQLTEHSGNRVIVPTFAITAHSTTDIFQLRDSRIQAIEGSLNSAVRDITSEETNLALSLLDAATVDSDRTIVVHDLTEDVLRNAYNSITLKDLVVANILINSDDFTSYILNRLSHLGDFQPGDTEATLWNARMLISNGIPRGSIFITAEPETIGVMPIRDFSVINADDPVHRAIGWLYRVDTGMCCHNSGGVVKIQLQ